MYPFFLATAFLLSSALTSATPESQGVASSAILRWINACEETSATNGFRRGYVHGFVILRHRKTIAEGSWAPQDTLNEPHMLYSHSKSFTSTAIGFLVDDGKLDLDERVISIFPDKAPQPPSENLRQLRVRDLLTMNVGADRIDSENDDIKGDWVRAFLANELQRAPGTGFRYDSGATHLLAAIVERKTGRKLMDFLGERLFRPLGMTSPWSTVSPTGIACGGWGMNMTTRDLARFGQFLLQEGRWNGQQLLSREWIRLATARQTWSGGIVIQAKTIGSGSDWTQGYGFQFWRCRHGAYRADGASGQLTVVFPNEDAVVSVHAGLGDMQRELDLIWKYLLPAFGEASLAEDETAHQALVQKCATLALPLEDSHFAVFQQMDKASVTRVEGGWELVRGSHHLAVGDGAWKVTDWTFTDDLIEPLFHSCGTRRIAATGKRAADGSLVVTWQMLGGISHGHFSVTMGPKRQLFAHYMGCLPAWNRDGRAVAQAAAEGLRQPKNYFHTCGGQFMNLWLVPPGTATNDESCARLEIARAKRAGIDGFVFDAWAGGDSARRLLDVFFKVVEADHLDFSLTICFDADCHTPNDKSKPVYEKFAESTRDLLAKHGHSRALARRDGKPLLFTYHLAHAIGREGPGEWRARQPLVEHAWKEFRRLVGTPVYLHGCIDGIPGIAFDKTLRYEVVDWAGRNFEAVGGFLGVSDDWRLDPKVAAVVKAAGAEWSQPLFPQYANHCGWIYSQAGFDTYRNNWKAAIDSGSTLLQLVTWNDYGEDTSVAPNFGSNYTTLRLTRHYADLWKTGREPVIVEDEIHACFRRVVGTPDAFPFRSRRAGKLPDVLEVLTFLTAPGRVEVADYGSYDAPAGFCYRQFPLKVGKVSAKVIRAGREVCGFAAPEEVSDKRWREDSTMVAYGSNYEKEWRTDFPNTKPLVYSENGDADGDGLPNWFEMLYFGEWPKMETATVADPNADPDGDGATNLEEYRRGTDPTKADTPYAPGFVWSTALPRRKFDGVFNPERDAKDNCVWWILYEENGRWMTAGMGDFDHYDWGAAKGRRYGWDRVLFGDDGKIVVTGKGGLRSAIAWESPIVGEVDVSVILEDGRNYKREGVSVAKGTRILFPDDFSNAPRSKYSILDFRVSLRQ